MSNRIKTAEEYWQERAKKDDSLKKSNNSKRRDQGLRVNYDRIYPDIEPLTMDGKIIVRGGSA